MVDSMPRKRSSPNPRMPNIEIVRVVRPSEEQVAKALRSAVRPPEHILEQIRWEENGRPPVRSDEVRAEVAAKAAAWAKSEVKERIADPSDYELRVSMPKGAIREKSSKILVLMLTQAKFYEDIEYNYYAALFYTYAANQAVRYRKGISKETIGWATELVLHADQLFDMYVSDGGKESNKSISVHDEIRSCDIHLRELNKLKPEDIAEINSVIDGQYARHGPDVDPADAAKISNDEFSILVSRKSSVSNALNKTALDMVYTAQDAMEYGSRGWARELLDIAQEMYDEYTKWQRMEGITPNTGDTISVRRDPRLHDHFLVHKALWEVRGQLNS